MKKGGPHEDGKIRQTVRALFVPFFDMKDKSYSLTYVGAATANIFGHCSTYPFMRTLCSVKLEKAKKVKQLLDASEEGDGISMVFISGEETASESI